MIGAGPSGCNIGAKLSSQGHDVRIFEEHSIIGVPVQCTGIVSNSIHNIIDLPDKVIENRIKKVKIYSPNGNYVTINFIQENIILNRKGFDQFLAKKAKQTGAEFFLNHRLIEISDGVDKKVCVFIKDGKRKKIKADIIIGCDGPLSAVAKLQGIYGKRRFLTGIQAVIKKENDNSIEFHPYIGALGWIVPEDSHTIRIGLLSKNKTRQLFNHFIERTVGKSCIKDITEIQGGVVPVYTNSIQTSKHEKKSRARVYLVGDSATQVKATTGGGIIQGLTAGNILAGCINNNKDYEKEWKSVMGKDLWVHLKLRHILDRMADADFNLLVRKFKSKSMRNILETIEREYPSKMVTKLFLNDPTLLYFGKFLL